MRTCHQGILLVFLLLMVSGSAQAWKISAGTAAMNDPIATPGFQTVTFSGGFFDVAPVVFVLAKDTPNNEPRALRIRNVTTAGFEILQTRPTVCGGCSDTAGFNVHTVNWIAIEPGRHKLPGGQFIEVGTLSTTTVQKKFAGTNGWDTVAFNTAFSSAFVAMLGQVQTGNNGGISLNGGQTSPFITTVISNADASGFQAALELSEVITPLPLANAETIGWLAAPSGLTSTLTDTGGGSVLIEAILSADNITHTCTINNNFQNTYTASPLVVASKNRRDGIDGGWIRECQINTGSVRVRVQEDEGTDNDVAHTTESVGIFVVEKVFDAEIKEANADWYVDGPVWTGAANEVIDSTINNFHGTTFGGISPVPGKVCNAADFSANSTADYISMNSNALDGLSNLTVSFWVNTTNTGNQAAISAANGSSGNEFLAWFPNNTSFRPFIKNVGLGTIAIPNIADGNWHHVVWTRNGATNCVAIDGVGSGCVGGGSTLPLNISAGGLIIGQEQDSVGGGFDINQDWQGQIDEIIVFQRDITSAEITELFNNQNAGNNWNGTPRVCPPPPPTVLTNWYMDETAWTGAVDEVKDSGGNNNHGTSFGGISTVPGKICSAGDFSANSTADYLSMNNNALDGLRDLTLSFWVNTTNTGTQAAISAANGGSGNEFLAWFPNNTSFLPFVKNTALGTITIPDIADGNWHHIAWTRIGASNCVSVDGVQSGCRSGSTAALNISPGGLIIGQEQDSVGGGFNINQDWEGEIDEVIVFQRGFSPTEITTLYTNQNAGNNWDGSGRVCPGGPLRMELGQITLNDTSLTAAFTAVTLQQSYTAVPLIFILPSNEGADPSSIRIRNVSTSGFEVSQVEPDNLDGLHAAMTVHYMAIEPGAGPSPWQFTLPDGQALEVGIHSTQTVQHGIGVSGVEGWDTVNFITTFTAPAVVAGLQGMVNESANPPLTTSVPWMTVAMRNAGPSSVELALERAEVATGTIGIDETIAYVAIEGDVQGSFVAGAATILYESITSADNITGWNDVNCAGNVGQAVGFVNTYSIVPLVIGHQSRHDGGDGGWLRRCSLSISQIGLAIDEDQFANAERNHTTETASLLVFSEAFCLPGGCFGSTIDHYAINYPLGTPGVTCEALAVSITAHDNVDAAVVPSNATTITLSTSPPADAWSLKTGNGTFVAPNQYTFDGTETSVEFWLTETTATTSPHIDIDVTDGFASDQDGVAEDDNIEFADAVFRFFADAAGENIGPQIAGKESSIAPGSQLIQLRSVLTSTSTGVCESRILNTQTVEMAYKCNNPTSCQALPSRVQIDNSSDIVPGNNNASVVDAANGSFSNVTLDFAATGTATFSFDYNDAGQIQLFARKTISPNPPDPAITLFGASNMFVVRPFGFDLQVPSSNPPHATGPFGNDFTQAASPFTITVRAVQWQAGDDSNNDGVPDGHQSGDSDPANNVDLSDNAVTPNYGQEVPATQADINLSALLDQPAGGINPGLTGGTTISTFSAGSGNTSTAQYDEVGIIEIRAGLANSNYLGSGQIQGLSGYVGRFIPFDFNVILNTPVFGPACGAFGYVGQAFTYTTAPVMTATARNATGATTQNYNGSFFKLTQASLTFPPGTDLGYASATGTLDTGLVPNKPTVSDSGNGIATLSFSDGGGIAFARGAPQAPFDAEISLALNIIDEDGVIYRDNLGVDQNPAGFADASAGNGISFSGNKQQRWGRLVLDNAFGSELLPLEIPLRAEYQTGTGFVSNPLDNCSPYAAVAISYSNRSGLTLDPVAGGSGILINGRYDPANPLILVNTLKEVGFVDVSHLTDSWLQYDWDGDSLHDNNPNVRASWGIYKGVKEFIYIREPWN